MMQLRLAALAGAIWVSSPAHACLPPPDDWTPPTKAEQDQAVVRWASWATDIVYGNVIRSRYGGRMSFQVLHVYKGRMKRGRIIRARQGWGLNAPMCAGLLGGPPPLPSGTHGVAVYRRDMGELNFVAPNELEVMFREGAIRRAPRDRPAASSP